MYHGIHELPALTCVKSLDHAQCAAWDWAHILCENVIPNLTYLWMGIFKGIDLGDKDYEISANTWEIIGEETAAAVKSIPAAFVRALGNIAQDHSMFTVESWSFWFMYVAPIILQGRFQHEKYYNHLCMLVDIMKMTLKYEITHVEIDKLERAIIKWVELYEK